jgi:putative IMPACT (imprinted ancient) family translation regulator
LLYKNAKHHCYALLIFDSYNQIIEKIKNNGEVGQPGKVLLNLLKKYELNHHALVVTRIFGGIKLGIGEVSRSFRKAGEAVIWYYSNKNKK